MAPPPLPVVVNCSSRITRGRHDNDLESRGSAADRCPACHGVGPLNLWWQTRPADTMIWDYGAARTVSRLQRLCRLPPG